MLWNHTFWLIFKFFIRSIISDENLIGLFKGWIETILASDYALVYFGVHPGWPLSYLIISSNVHDFLPDVFVIWIAWYFEYRFLIVLKFFLELLFELESNVDLCLSIHGNAAFSWRFTIFGITWSGRSWAIIDNYVFGVANHRNFAKYFYATFFVVAFFLSWFFASTFYKGVQLLLIHGQWVWEVFINW